MKTTHQSGFAIITLLIILAVIGTAGFTGYKAYTARNQTEGKAEAELAKKPKAEAKEENTIPDNWKSFTDEAGFSLRYPADWHLLPPIFPGVKMALFSNQDSYVDGDENSQFIYAGTAAGASFEDCYEEERIKRSKIILSDSVTFAGVSGRRLVIDPSDDKPQYGIAYVSVKDGQCYHLVYAAGSASVRDAGVKMFSLVAHSFKI